MCPYQDGIDKIALRHSPIHNLDMPAMTMVFKASDPAPLEIIKPGDSQVTVD